MPAAASISVPEVLTNGLSESSSAAPIACWARMSARHGAGEVTGAHRVVLVREMDDAVGGRGGLLEARDVVEIPATDLGAGRLERRRRAIRTRQADDLVAGGEQFGDDGGANVSGCTGDEDTHENLPGH